MSTPLAKRAVDILVRMEKEREEEKKGRKKRRRKKKEEKVEAPVEEPVEEEEKEEREDTPLGFVDISEIPFPCMARYGEYIIHIVEIHKAPVPWNPHYLVTVRLQDGVWLSPPFTIPAKDAKELAEKIKQEIKLYETRKETEGRLMGLEVVRRGWVRLSARTT
ncbi:MAG: hypothetical protein DRP01_06795 [Archaeoglobales archaeon]|nr:MAG: hypothetical protein DRP01_06795 [Archaeoglobales archaeon]